MLRKQTWTNLQLFDGATVPIENEWFVELWLAHSLVRQPLQGMLFSPPRVMMTRCQLIGLSMSTNVSSDKLSRISTQWTLLQQAHAGSADAVILAQRQLMQRYCGSVYRYLLGALRNEDEAMNLFQEFALRFIRGDFHRATPERGRFRDYVKSALINLVNDYHRERGARPQPLPEHLPQAVPGEATDGSEDRFLQSWREELLNRAWQDLEDANPAFHAVLLHHVQQPDAPSSELAEMLTQKLGKPMSAGHVRVTLHRARERFAELLVLEVKESLESPSEAELQSELKALGLLQYCSRVSG